MHPSLEKAIKRNQPQINPKIANGYSSERLKNAITYIKELFRITEPKFKCDFRLDRIEMASPEETFEEITKSRNNKKRHLEIVRSDYYMVKLFASIDGQPIDPTNLFVPYSKGYNLLQIRGSQFMINPVMADTALSAMQNSLFIQVSCAPLNFRRRDYSVIENGEIKTNHVIYAKKIHAAHKKVLGNRSVRQLDAELCIAHYVLCAHGLTDTLSRYTSKEVKAGRIDTSNLDRNEWRVYSSMYAEGEYRNSSPNGYRMQSEIYEPHDFKIAVRIKDVTPLLESLIYTMFYIMDLFPHEVMNAGDHNYDDPMWWRILLGHIVHSDKLPHPTNIKKMNQHMDSILSYLDDVTKYELHRTDVRVDNIIDLFVWVCENFSDKVREYHTGFSCDGKRLMVERYVFSDLLHKINDLAWRIANDVTTKGSLTPKEVHDRMTRSIRSDCLMKITTNHGEVESIQTSSNCAIPKITSLICPQVKSGTRGKHSEINRDDPAQQLTVSLVVNCSVRDPTKSVPTGHNKANMFSKLTAEGDIQSDPELDLYVNRMNEVF